MWSRTSMLFESSFLHLRNISSTSVGSSSVDKGTIDLVGTNDETTTQGLDGLVQYCQQYYNTEAPFAKWRVVLKLAPTEPSLISIMENASRLVHYEWSISYSAA
ncbi:hypothetical protein L7F22_008197 [Adiantum nelumboides]|nr:hypothetical protein [Adiantum nelumboides]